VIWFVRLRRWEDPDGEALALLALWALVMVWTSILSDDAPDFSRTLSMLPALFVAVGLGLNWLIHLRFGAARLRYGLAAAVVIISAGWATYDYFVRFARLWPEYYRVYDTHLVDMIDHLTQYTDDHEVYMSLLWSEKAPARFLRAQSGIKSIDTSDIVVMPPPGRGAVYAFPLEQIERAQQLRALWPDAELRAIADPMGAPYFVTLRIAAADLAGWPAQGDAPLTPAVALGAEFEDAPTLLGVRTAPDTGAVTLFWRAEESMLRDLTSFIHLHEADGRQIGQVDKRPGNDSYRTPQWSPGERVIDRYYPQPAQPCRVDDTIYLHVGWYELAADGARRPRRDGEGDTAVVGPIPWPLRSVAADAVEPEHVVNQPVRDGLRLAGYALEDSTDENAQSEFDDGTLTTDSTVQLDLYWQGDAAQATRPLSILLDDGQAVHTVWTGEIAEEAIWREGEVLCRRVQFPLPDDLHAGAHQLQIAVAADEKLVDHPRTVTATLNAHTQNGSGFKVTFILDVTIVPDAT